jgi:hypothetical protein
MLLRLLSGSYSILENGDDFVSVCVSSGWCAAITIDPESPLEKWQRICLGPEPTEHGRYARPVFKALAVGLYEAHCTPKGKEPLVVYFEVTDSGELKILGTQGDEDRVLATLNWLTLDELHEAREAQLEADGLPPLEETFKQNE